MQHVADRLHLGEACPLQGGLGVAVEVAVVEQPGPEAHVRQKILQEPCKKKREREGEL